MHIRYCLEAIKKICKKYRYMFRSDALYKEMNYMIDNLSEHLLISANVKLFTNIYYRNALKPFGPIQMTMAQFLQF